jgi:hypothetical protein
LNANLQHLNDEVLELGEFILHRAAAEQLLGRSNAVRLIFGLAK